MLWSFCALLSAKWLFRAELASDRSLHSLFLLHMFDEERKTEKRARRAVPGKRWQSHKRTEMRHLMSVIFGRCITWLLSLMLWRRQTLIWISAGETGRTLFPLLYFLNMSKHFFPSAFFWWAHNQNTPTSVPLPKESNSNMIQYDAEVMMPKAAIH